MYCFDKVVDEISGSKRYTAVLIITIYLSSILSGTVVVAPVFLAGFPPSRCRVEPYDNKTLYPNLTNELITEVFIPWNPTLRSYDRCTRKIIDCQNIEDCLEQNVTVEVASCNGSYIYDRSNYEETIVTEWNVVCSDYTLVTLSTSLSFLGALLGSCMGGVLADRFGRALVLRSEVFALGALGCGLAFSPNMLTYTVLHFLEVLAAFQGNISGFTYISEITPTRWRTACGLLFFCFWSLGVVSLSFFATHWRKWREQHFKKTLALVIPIFLATCLLPKSPRWLFAQDRKSEAKKVCRLIAKRNKTELLDSTWAAVEKENMSESSEMLEKQNTLKESFNRPYTRLLVIANLVVWFSSSSVYFGLTMNIGSLAGDPYLNNALSGLVDIAACITGIAAISFFGFNKTIVGSLSVATAACLISTVTIELGRGVDAIDKLGTALALLGRLGANVTFSSLFAQTTQLFPTCGRSTILGLASMGAMTGSMIAPWTIQLQYIIPWLTQAVLGVVSLFGVFVASLFPEAKGHELTMTFDQAEEFFRNAMKDSTVAKLFGLPRNKFIATAKRTESLAEEIELVT